MKIILKVQSNLKSNLNLFSFWRVGLGYAQWCYSVLLMYIITVNTSAIYAVCAYKY